MPDELRFSPEECTYEDFNSADVNNGAFQNDLKIKSENNIDQIKESSFENKILLANDEEERIDLSNTKIRKEAARLFESYENLPAFTELVKKQQDLNVKKYSNYGRTYTMSEPKDTERMINLVFVDIEAICRHSFAIGADNLIFLDRQARPFSLFTEEMLPVIRIEYCKINNIEIDSVKLPNIFHILSHRDKFVNEDQILEKLGPHLVNKTNIVFDEATDQSDDRNHAWIGLEPNDQYEMFNYIESSNEEWKKIQSDVRSGIVKDSAVPSCGKLAARFARIMPQGTFESHAARYGGSGGSLSWLGFDTWVEKNKDPDSNFAELATEESLNRMTYRGRLPISAEEMTNIRNAAKALAKEELSRICEALHIDMEHLGKEENSG